METLSISTKAILCSVGAISCLVGFVVCAVFYPMIAIAVFACLMLSMLGYCGYVIARVFLEMAAENKPEQKRGNIIPMRKFR